MMHGHLVDFHCHLDLYPDMESAITTAERFGVYTLAVTTTPRAWPRNLALTCRTRFVRSALGLHPQLVATHGDEFGLWEKYLPQTRYVGEVGLDAGPRFYRSIDLQKQIFKRVLLNCAAEGGKILSVHSVRAVTAVLDLLEAHLPTGKGQVVLHWFTGSNAELRRAVQLGCLFSVNAQMIQSNRGRNLVSEIPLDRLLTETDGPFTQVGARAAAPGDVAGTVEALSELRQVPVDQLTARIRTTLRNLLASS